jgi:L-cysteate sulfo-lyase
MSSDGLPSEPVPLGTWPTPLEPAPRLAVALGLRTDDLWIKRDDLTGLGGGGNKVRKLQHTCAAALARKATTLVTTGAAQSNHARLTAAAGARLGLDVVLVLAGGPDAPVSGNLVLDRLFGARIRWAGAVDDVELQRQAESVVHELGGAGVQAELIPFGGSSVVGAQGYVDCGRELLAQAPELTHVIVALGSGGTMAGLVHALGPARVLGVNVGAVPDPGERVRDLVAGLEAEAGSTTSAAGALRLRTDQVGAGYSELTGGVKSALRLAARTEGLILDPIYTGRALAGLRAAVAEGSVRPGERTVFLHSGGLPGFFGHPDTQRFAGKTA